jgi:hypothetical protein
MVRGGIAGAQRERGRDVDREDGQEAQPRRPLDEPQALHELGVGVEGILAAEHLEVAHHVLEHEQEQQKARDGHGELEPHGGAPQLAK